MSQPARSLTPAWTGDPDRLRIDEALGEALDEARRCFGGNARTGPIFDHVRDFILSGGKRIRPRLCIASHRILDGGREPSRPVWLTAASLEIFHAFMLVHDDIIDQSSMRRDRPTLHETFRMDSDLSEAQEARKRGTDLALLSGDLLCALAMRLVARSGLPDAAMGRASALIADMLVETGLGEALDVLYEKDPLEDLEEEPLVETYLRKTARYTVSGPLVLGAAIAGASRAVCRALEEFGDLLGFGFQIQNDLNSLAEDIELGDHSDLDTGKRTYVLWRAHQELDAEGRRELVETLAEPVSIDRRKRLLHLIEASGAIKRCEARVARLQREAVEVLRKSSLTVAQRRAYIQLVEEFRLKAKAPRPSYVPATSALGSELACNP